MRKTSLIILLLFSYITAIAQNTGSSVEMADVMRSNGKIYVVVVICAIILTGLILYLFNLDRRIRKIEKEIKP